MVEMVGVPIISTTGQPHMRSGVLHSMTMLDNTLHISAHYRHLTLPIQHHRIGSGASFVQTGEAF